MNRSEGLRKYEVFTSRDCEKDEERGGIDGARDEPATASQEFDGYQSALINEVRADVVAYLDDSYKRGVVLDSKLARQIETRRSYDIKREDLLQQQELDERSLEEKGEEAGGLRRAEEDYQEAEIALSLARDAVGGRRLHSHLTPKVYFGAMAFLALLELPINLEAAESVFSGMRPILAWAIAIIVGILLILFAHTSGKILKQRDVLNLNRWPSRVIGIGLGVMSVGALVAIYYLRWRYLELRQEGDLGELLFFLFLNGSVFFIGLLLAVFHYDASHDYQRTTYDFDNAKKALRKAERQFEEIRGTLTASYDGQLVRLTRLAERLDGEISESKNDLQRLATDRKRAIEVVLAVLKRRLIAYQIGNARTRQTAAPKYFSEDEMDQYIGRMRAAFATE